MSTEPPVEIELKYRVASIASGERLLNGDMLGTFTADGPPRTAESEDRYIDTHDGALARAGFAARLRRTRGTTVVSVKSLGHTDGSLQRRTEIEGPADRTLAPAAWPISPARAFVLELCGDGPLVELVTVRQMRRKRMFRDADTVVEFSLDEVEVIARTEHVDRFTEVEIELASGPEAPLLALRTLLDGEPGLTPSPMSKLDAALAALAAARLPRQQRATGVREARSPRRADRPASAASSSSSSSTRSPDGSLAAAPRPESDSAASAAASPAGSLSGDVAAAAEPAAEADVEAVVEAVVDPKRERGSKKKADALTVEAMPVLVVGRTPGVVGGDIVAEAGRKVLRFHLARLIAREPGTRLGEDPEELHGMRVATRRMRAAWRVFGDGFRPESTRKYRNRLRDLAGKLGAVRDIDVLVVALEAYRAPLPASERAALDPLLDDWRAQREAGRAVLMRELDSKRQRKFVEDYLAFVQTPGAGAIAVSPTQPHHVRDTAGSHLWLAYETVLAYGPVLRWADAPTLHQLRIAGKWLRYTLEFVAEALGPEGRPLIERVVAMQDHLGLMNDAEVAAMKARALLVARSGTLSDAESGAIARYLTAQEREVARLKRGATAPWRGLSSPAFRRSLGRALANLTASPGGPAGS